MAEQKATNITWHEHHVSRDERASLKGHKGACLWYTGLSGSGKSTIANAVDTKLFERGIHTYVLDGDNIRHGLNKILGTIHPYPTMAEGNKFAAGEWKKARKPEKLLGWVEKYHDWRRG